MAKVTLFRTTDGQLHDTQAKHDKHEARLRAKPALEAMVENTTWVFDGIAAGDNRDADILLRSQLADFINDHSAELRKILTDSLTAKRAPRKLKSVKSADRISLEKSAAAFVAASTNVAGSGEPAKANPFPGDAYFLGQNKVAAA